MITIDNSILITVDIQEKLFPAMDEKERLVDQAAKMISGARELGLLRLYTQQYTKGIGMSVKEIINAECGEDSADFKYIEKSSFSVMGEESFVAKLPGVGLKENIILQGIESHICILQSALDLLDRGYKVYVLADAIASRKALDYVLAIARLEQAGVIITTVEAILFELMGSAGHPCFKAISKIIK